jgi:hypothetical protein
MKTGDLLRHLFEYNSSARTLSLPREGGFREQATLL